MGVIGVREAILRSIEGVKAVNMAVRMVGLVIVDAGNGQHLILKLLNYRGAVEIPGRSQRLERAND